MSVAEFLSIQASLVFKTLKFVTHTLICSFVYEIQILRYFYFRHLWNSNHKLSHEIL